MKLCSPALLYLLLSIIPVTVLIFYNVGISVFLVEIFFVALWTIILNFLCKKGFSIVSWILVLLPIFVVTFLILSFEYELTHIEKSLSINNI